MKVLLDENLDRRYRSGLLPHEAFTAAYMGWAGLRNGTLMKTASEAGFQVLLTGDQTLPHEQNVGAQLMAVVVLSRTEWEKVQGYLPQIIAAIEAALPGQVTLVDCGVFSRKRARRDKATNHSA